MAKVMISMPEDLLERFDQHARSQAKTRSGLIQELAERELSAGDEERRAEIEELLGEPGHYGESIVELIRQERERNDP